MAKIKVWKTILRPDKIIKTSSGHVFVVNIRNPIQSRTRLYINLKPNYSKHTRSIVAITEINKQTQA